jgi:hypothetical protein
MTTDPFKTLSDLTRLLGQAGDPLGQPTQQELREFFKADAVPIKTLQTDLGQTPRQDDRPPPVIYL